MDYKQVCVEYIMTGVEFTYEEFGEQLKGQTVDEEYDIIRPYLDNVLLSDIHVKNGLSIILDKNVFVGEIHKKFCSRRDDPTILNNFINLGEANAQEICNNILREFGIGVYPHQVKTYLIHNIYEIDSQHIRINK